MHALSAERVAALEAYLAQRLPGFEGPLSVEPFTGGQSNPTYHLLTPTASWVMRCKPAPAARLMPSAHAIEREFRVMSALAGTAVPVPAMALLCEDETIIGRAFYVMQFLEGRVLWEPDLPGFSRRDRERLYDDMNRVIAALHAVDVQAAGLADYGRPGNYFERQIARWRKQYQACATEPIAAMDRLAAWLPDHLPASARDDRHVAIVHGDYRIDNLMFHPTEPRAVALLDWELSTLGHPLADFSYHCMAWHIAPALYRGLAGADLETLGIPCEETYLRRYCERSGRTDAEAIWDDWNFYVAYNLFRMTGIVQGIAKRIEEGTAVHPDAHRAAVTARPLAEMGWRFAQRA